MVVVVVVKYKIRGMRKTEFLCYEPVYSSKNNSGNIWDHSDSEVVRLLRVLQSTLPSRSLLCRPLNMDIGRCTCVTVKEKSVDGLNGGSVYTLYTNVMFYLSSYFVIMLMYFGLNYLMQFHNHYVIWSYWHFDIVCHLNIRCNTSGLVLIFSILLFNHAGKIKGVKIKQIQKRIFVEVYKINLGNWEFGSKKVSRRIFNCIKVSIRYKI